MWVETAEDAPLPDSLGQRRALNAERQRPAPYRLDRSPFPPFHAPPELNVYR